MKMSVSSHMQEDVEVNLPTSIVQDGRSLLYTYDPPLKQSETKSCRRWSFYLLLLCFVVGVSVTAALLLSTTSRTKRKRSAGGAAPLSAPKNRTFMEAFLATNETSLTEFEVQECLDRITTVSSLEISLKQGNNVFLLHITGETELIYSNQSFTKDLMDRLLGCDMVVGLPPSPSSSYQNETKGERLCNGLASNCNKRVNEVLFATLHNAMASKEDGFDVAPNHLLSLETALEAGFRGINLDLALCDGQLKLVHSFCWLGTRDPVQVFSYLADFVNANPNEILIVPLEINNDGGQVSLQMIYEMLQAAGVADRLYSHMGKGQAWPTIETLLENRQNLVLFYYNGEHCGGDNDIACPPGLMPYFDYTIESRYGFAAMDELVDTEFACEVTRGFESTYDFYGVNVFLNVPNEEVAYETNSRDFLAKHLEACSSLYNHRVNLLYVDFWSIGQVLDAVRAYNLVA